MSISQICIECNQDKPIENYYLIDGLKPFKSCKECVKTKKRASFVKTPKGFQKVDKDTQEEIRKMLADRKITIKDIAEKFGLKYPTLCYWVRMNHV